MLCNANKWNVTGGVIIVVPRGSNATIEEELPPSVSGIVLQNVKQKDVTVRTHWECYGIIRIASFHLFFSELYSTSHKDCYFVR